MCTLPKQYTTVVERKYFTCPSRESNPGRWIYRQTLYHVAVKAGFYRKAVEVCYIPSPMTFSPTKLNFVPEVPGHRESFLMRLGELLPGSRMGYLRWAPLKIFYLPQPGIEPRSLDLQANTLPRRCKSRLLPQGSRSDTTIIMILPRWHIVYLTYTICSHYRNTTKEAYCVPYLHNTLRISSYF